MKKAIAMMLVLIGVVASAAPIKSMLGSDGSEINVMETEYTASDYIQDGLVFHFDGIENSQYGEHSDSHVIDLVTGNILNLKSHVDIENDCISCLATMDRWFIFSLGGFQSDQTIEAVFQTTDLSSKNQLVIVHNFYRRLIGVGGTMLGVGLRQGVSAAWYVPGDMVSVTATYEGNSQTAKCAYVDGIAYSTKSASFATPTGTELTVGYGYKSSNVDSNTGFSGRIYALRIYNRVLTPYEVMLNYTIDKERFGL